MKLVVRVIVAIGLGMVPSAHAWGPYAHQQIHRVAVQLIADTALGPWMGQNLTTGQRLSMSPDIDWKRFGPDPADPQLKAIRDRANEVEAPTHFFDADIFAREIDADQRPDFSHLSGRSDYGGALSALQAAIRANAPYLRNRAPGVRVDWDNPTPQQVAALGSGPWRVLQMYDLAVGALANGEEPKAMVYLSALGHYVADMAVPLHTTVHYDGDRDSAHGVHLAWEMKLVEGLAADRGANKNDSTQLWKDFSATEADVTRLATGQVRPVARERILDHVLGLVAGGYGLVEPLSAAWSAAAGPEGTPESERLARFRDSRIVLRNGRIIDPVIAAKERMAEASRLIAALWTSAYREARTRNPAMRPPTSPVAFSDALAIANYVPPHYLDRRPPPPAMPYGSGCVKALEEMSARGDRGVRSLPPHQAL